MPPQFYFYCYPWDLEDEGLETSLGRLAGEIGVDAICISAVMPEIHQFRTRAGNLGRVFKCDSAVHFQPDSKLYGSTRIRPSAAAWMKTRNSLERIQSVAEREKLKVRAEIRCCVGRSLVRKHPFAACINALGAASDRVVCLNNPEIREYLAALVEDLSTNYRLDTLELSDLRSESAADNDDRDVVGPSYSQAAMALLSLCFCSSCRQKAYDDGLDVDAVAIATRKHLENWIDNPSLRSLERETLFQQEPKLYEYNALLSHEVLGVLELLKKRSRCRLVFHSTIPFRKQFLQEVLARVDGLVIGETFVNPESSFNGLKELEQFDASKIDVVIPCAPCCEQDGPQLVTTTHRSAQAGYRGIGFCDYGRTPETSVDWVRQAIRYAKRETR